MKWLGTTALTLAMAAPAAAQVGTVYTINDGCGDADQRVLSVNGNDATFPSERAPWHDIGHATLTPRADGSLDVKLQVCGAVPAPDRIGNSWEVNVDVGNDCDVSIWAYDVYGNAPRQASIRKSCTTTTTNELGFVTTRYGEVARVDLPATAWSLSGAVFDFHLSKSHLTGVGAGKVLKNPIARTTDGMQAGVYYGNAFVRGPGAEDHAFSTGTVTLS